MDFCRHLREQPELVETNGRGATKNNETIRDLKVLSAENKRYSESFNWRKGLNDIIRLYGDRFVIIFQKLPTILIRNHKSLSKRDLRSEDEVPPEEWNVSRPNRQIYFMKKKSRWPHTFFASVEMSVCIQRDDNPKDFMLKRTWHHSVRFYFETTGLKVIFHVLRLSCCTHPLDRTVCLKSISKIIKMIRCSSMARLSRTILKIEKAHSNEGNMNPISINNFVSIDWSFRGLFASIPWTTLFCAAFVTYPCL